MGATYYTKMILRVECNKSLFEDNPKTFFVCGLRQCSHFLRSPHEARASSQTLSKMANNDNEVYEIGQDGGFDLSVSAKEHNYKATQRTNSDRQRRNPSNSQSNRQTAGRSPRAPVVLPPVNNRNQGIGGIFAKNIVILFAAVAYTFGYESIAFSLVMVFVMSKILSV
jgi:hypothetical protein